MIPANNNPRGVSHAIYKGNHDAIITLNELLTTKGGPVYLVPYHLGQCIQTNTIENNLSEEMQKCRTQMFCMIHNELNKRGFDNANLFNFLNFDVSLNKCVTTGNISLLKYIVSVACEHNIQLDIFDNVSYIYCAVRHKHYPIIEYIIDNAGWSLLAIDVDELLSNMCYVCPTTTFSFEIANYLFDKLIVSPMQGEQMHKFNDILLDVFFNYARDVGSVSFIANKINEMHLIFTSKHNEKFSKMIETVCNCDNAIDILRVLFDFADNHNISINFDMTEFKKEKCSLFANACHANCFELVKFVMAEYTKRKYDISFEHFLCGINCCAGGTIINFKLLMWLIEYCVEHYKKCPLRTLTCFAQCIHYASSPIHGEGLFVLICKYGNSDFLKSAITLAAKMGEPFDVSKDGELCLYYAVSYGNVECADFLRKTMQMTNAQLRDLLFNILDKLNLILLCKFDENLSQIFERQFERTKHLLKESDMMRLFELCCEHGATSLLPLLFPQLTNLNDDDLLQYLRIACRNHKLGVVKWLLKNSGIDMIFVVATRYNDYYGHIVNLISECMTLFGWSESDYIVNDNIIELLTYNCFLQSIPENYFDSMFEYACEQYAPKIIEYLMQLFPDKYNIRINSGHKLEAIIKYWYDGVSEDDLPILMMDKLKLQPDSLTICLQHMCIICCDNSQKSYIRLPCLCSGSLYCVSCFIEWYVRQEEHIFCCHCQKYIDGFNKCTLFI